MELLWSNLVWFLFLLNSRSFPSFHNTAFFFFHPFCCVIRPNYSHFHYRCLPTSLKLSTKAHFLSQELIQVFFFSSLPQTKAIFFLKRIIVEAIKIMRFIVFRIFFLVACSYSYSDKSALPSHHI